MIGKTATAVHLIDLAAEVTKVPKFQKLIVTVKPIIPGLARHIRNPWRERALDVGCSMIL